MNIDNLCNRCKDAIEDAARESYNEGNVDSLCDCSATIDVGPVQIEIVLKNDGSHEVTVFHKNNNESPNVEKRIEDYLDAHADEQGAWQDEYDNDIYRDVDSGCDPAFPHCGDFERWAY